VRVNDLIRKYHDVRYGDEKLSKDEIKKFQDDFHKLAKDSQKSE
jgi:hypothetical protein